MRVNGNLQLLVDGHKVVIELVGQDLARQQMRPCVEHVLVVAETVTELEHFAKGFPHAQHAVGLREGPFHGRVRKEDFLAGAEGRDEDGEAMLVELLRAGAHKSALVYYHRGNHAERITRCQTSPYSEEQSK